MQDGAHFTATQLLEIKECFCVHPVLYVHFVAIHNTASLPEDKSFPCFQFSMLDAPIEEIRFITLPEEHVWLQKMLNRLNKLPTSIYGRVFI
jgi:hypothetical protein